MTKIVIYINVILCLNIGVLLADFPDDGPVDSTGGLATNIGAIDTVKAIHVIAIFPEDTLNYGADYLPSWYLAFGDTSDYGPGQIYKRSSFGKLSLEIDVNPGLNNNFFVLPHTREWYYAASDSDMTDYAYHIMLMNTDIVTGLDSLIDFADFDEDNDGYVDYLSIDYDNFWFNRPYIGWALLKFAPDSSTIMCTNDTNQVGDTICVNGYSAAHFQRLHNWGNWYYSENNAWFNLPAAVWVHEAGHHIPGIEYTVHSWRDHYQHGYQFHSVYWYIAFPNQNGPGTKNAYFSPYWAQRLNWLTDNEIKVVYSPLYQDTLSDYIDAGDLYKYYAEPDEYFLVSNRQGIYNNDDNWPSYGLMIYHIDASVSVQNNLYHKCEDLETTDDLFVLNADSTELIAAPDSGLDEIDFRNQIYRSTSLPDSVKEYLIGLTGANWGDSGDAFTPPMDIVFDHTTNPNSNLYSTHGGKWYQDVPSHFSIRNLEADPNDSTKLIMDVLANHWYDSLTANTTWGSLTQETGYALTGDFIIPAGYTLTIRKGTKIYFQADEDDKTGGASSSRCELIVYGTLIAEGDSANHVEVNLSPGNQLQNIS